MQDREAFALAMAALGVNARQEVSKEQLELFWRFLSDLTDAEFQEAVARWIRRRKFFPQVAELLEIARPHMDPAAEAVQAFEQVVKTGVHDARTGPRWNVRRVAELVGPAAAMAYVAAGGSSAFEHELGEKDLAYLRKRFVDSYVDSVEAIARGQDLADVAFPPLPPGTPAQQLIADTAKRLAMPR